MKTTHTRKTYSTLHNQRGFTLVEILAVLIILAIFTTKAIAKYSDIEDTAGRRMLETAVGQLNEHVRHAWYNSLLANGIGGYSFYEGSLGEDVLVTKQKPGEEPKQGHICLKRDGVQYKLEWLTGSDKVYGHFELGIREE